jgi:hypothetical protein
MLTSSDPATIVMSATVLVAALIGVIVLLVILAGVVREHDRLKQSGDSLKQRTDRAIATQQVEIDAPVRFRDIRDAAAAAEQVRNASKALYESAKRKEQEILSAADLDESEI